MNTATNYAAHYLADIPNNQDEHENEVRDYPASSVVRFLWLYHLKLNNDPRFNEAAKQTGIYLQNPYWIQFQLPDSAITNDNGLENPLIISPEIIKTGEDDETKLQSVDTDIKNPELPVEPNEQAKFSLETFEEQSLLPVEENKSDEELPQTVNEPAYPADREIIENPILENENPVDPNTEEDQKVESIVSNENEGEEILEHKNVEDLFQTVNEPAYPADREIIENPILENKFQDDQNDEESKNDEPIVSNENEGEEILEQKIGEELPQTVNEPAYPADREIIENSVLENEYPVDQNTEEDQKVESIVSNENEGEEILEQKIGEELPQTVNEEIIENSVLENEDPVDQNKEDQKEEPIVLNENEEERNTLNEINNEDQQKEDHISKEDDDAIHFEPLHTVDYFASQGIKLSEEALNNDQLGKQVKSFTAWLKSMKKLHPGQLPEQNEVIERLIQTSSEASNQSADVLTEAMAEVLVKQGKREKAIEMYQKLSLINPSKSAYFAAKIESLKII